MTKFLHAIGDVERIGDHAMNIAECAKEIGGKEHRLLRGGHPGS